MSNEFPPSSPFLDHQQHDDPFSSFTAPSKQTTKKLVINSPFNKQSPTKAYDQLYPTPNPSSSAGVGRSSSPARQQSADVGSKERESTPVAINPATTDEVIKESQVRYTTPNALKVKLTADRKTTLGRSSQCDYYIKSKFASRVHMKLHYNSESNELTVLCKGHNGVVIDFGVPCYGYIRELGGASYRLETIDMKDVKNKEEEVHTHLSVFKDEQIVVPFNDRLALNVKDHVTALEIVYDESETEDELLVLKDHTFKSPEREVVISPSEDLKSSPMDTESKGNPAESPIRQSVTKLGENISKPAVEADTILPVESKPVVEAETVVPVESRPVVEAETVAPVESRPVELKPVELKPVELKKEITPITIFETPAKETPIEITTLKAQALERCKSVEPESINSKPLLKRSKSIEIKTPLQPKDKNSLNQQTTRRRKAEPGLSPQKKKVDSHLKAAIPSTTTTPSLSTPSTLTPTVSNNSITTTDTIKRKYIDPREKISNLKVEEILSTIDGLDAIKNVLTNHLAFSRLSQTPLKQLQTISGLTSNLTRQQLRATLASIKCVGVIYRHGKDAAGKPLEEEYYYDAENDKDFQRTQMVSSIKGSSGLRNCRKTHKQYFWKKPVTKK